MCGIVGYIGARPVLPLLVEGLRRLEYRGYDSAGIAIAADGRLAVYKRKGKVRELESVLPAEVPGSVGIAHTRWATHGAPSDLNAHPHVDGGGRIGVVHNGIIENAVELKRKLQADGVVFVSETDTEVLAHLIARRPENSLVEAVRGALRQVKGAYGLAVVDAARPDVIVAARNGGPVVVGVGEGEMFVASDASALMGHARSVAHLDDGEVAEVRADGFTVLTLEGAETTKATLELSGDAAGFDKGDYAHFMRKEIGEQPEAVRRTLLGRLDHRFSTAHLGGIELAAREMLDIRRVKILGCGSAFYAGTLGAHLIEQLARIPAHAEPASEFRYRNPVIEQDTLYVAVSQSGRPSTPWPPSRRSSGRADVCLGSSTAWAPPSPANAAAASTCTPAPRWRWCPPRPGPRRPWPSPCWRCSLGGFAISPRARAPACWRRWRRCRTRSPGSSRARPSSRRSSPGSPAPSTPTSWAAPRATRWRWRGR